MLREEELLPNFQIRMDDNNNFYHIAIFANFYLFQNKIYLKYHFFLLFKREIVII